MAMGSCLHPHGRISPHPASTPPTHPPPSPPCIPRRPPTVAPGEGQCARGSVRAPAFTRSLAVVVACLCPHPAGPSGTLGALQVGAGPWPGCGAARAACPVRAAERV